MFRTSKSAVTNLKKRLYVCASEDVGPAFLSLIVLLDKYIINDGPQIPFNELAVVRCVDLLAEAPKDRTLDWLCHSDPANQSWFEEDVDPWKSSMPRIIVMKISLSV